MRLIGLGVVLALGLALAPLAAEAQEPGKVYRVGRLSVSVAEPASSEAFRRGLRELGWVVDQNVVVEQHNAGGDLKRLAAVAAELARMNVDVIVAAGSDAVEAAFRATKSIPIVMAVGSDPERRGWIKSLARPGGNVTGLIAFLPEMGSKRVELVKDLLPRARRVGVMTDSSPNMQSEFEHIEAAGRSLGLEIQYVRVMSSEDLDAAFTLLRKAPPDALYVQASSRVLDGLRSRIAAFGIASRLPVIGTIPYHAESGFLLSYGTSIVGWHHRSAYFVDKILKGAKPGDLPVEQPTKFDLVINLKTAKALGLTIPQTLLLRADQVIHP